ncbi:MAG: hypothetical protein Q8S13_01150, partial [Dehalococcoidia bacterium]|nr:hypothetical protein [Dehalococcoidia bacterium]
MESAGEQEPPRAARGAEAGESGAARPRRRPLTPDLELREIRKGTKPGSRYVRVVRRRDRPFERVETGVYRATEAAIKPRSRVEQGWRLVKRVLVGAPLATSQLVEERLSKLKALAVFASDNLSSSAY